MGNTGYAGHGGNGGIFIRRSIYSVLSEYGAQSEGRCTVGIFVAVMVYKKHAACALHMEKFGEDYAAVCHEHFAVSLADI